MPSGPRCDAIAPAITPSASSAPSTTVAGHEQKHCGQELGDPRPDPSDGFEPERREDVHRFRCGSELEEQCLRQDRSNDDLQGPAQLALSGGEGRGGHSRLPGRYPELGCRWRSPVSRPSGLPRQPICGRDASRARVLRPRCQPNSCRRGAPPRCQPNSHGCQRAPQPGTCPGPSPAPGRPKGERIETRRCRSRRSSDPECGRRRENGPARSPARSRRSPFGSRRRGGREG